MSKSLVGFGHTVSVFAFLDSVTSIVVSVQKLVSEQDIKWLATLGAGRLSLVVRAGAGYDTIDVPARFF